MLISGCGRKAAPKYVEGGSFPKTYPAPDKVPGKNKPTEEKNQDSEKKSEIGGDEKP